VFKSYGPKDRCVDNVNEPIMVGCPDPLIKIGECTSQVSPVHLRISPFTSHWSNSTWGGLMFPSCAGSKNRSSQHLSSCICVFFVFVCGGLMLAPIGGSAIRWALTHPQYNTFFQTSRFVVQDLTHGGVFLLFNASFISLWMKPHYVAEERKGMEQEKRTG